MFPGSRPSHPAGAAARPHGAVMRPASWFPAVLAALTLAAALGVMTRELDKPLLGPHAFRQTQTAISAHYMAGDAGMFADYITPVLGKPWRIPMELPVYQWVVARLHGWSGLPLDPAGKIVAVAAWLLCLGPAWSILRNCGAGRAEACTGLALLLSSPLYLFWGASFMIETTALLLGLAAVALALRAAWGPGAPGPAMAAALVCGCAAAMVKAPTWAVAAGTGGLLVLVHHPRKERVPWTRRLPVLCVLAAPVLAARWWLAWSDAVKSANPYAREMLLAESPGQLRWNFGTWEQKLDPAVWAELWKHADRQLLPGPGWVGIVLVLLLLGAGLWVAPRLRLPILVLLAGFASGPVVFMNLYFKHSYYWCANGVWLLSAVGLAWAGLCAWVRRQPVRGLGRALWVLPLLWIAFGFQTWHQRRWPVLKKLPTAGELAATWVQPVQQAVPPGRTLIVIGNDWNPAPLYYAQRKGIAVPGKSTGALAEAPFLRSLALLESEEQPAAVLVEGGFWTDANRPALESFLRGHGFSVRGRPCHFGLLFHAADRPEQP